MHLDLVMQDAEQVAADLLQKRVDLSEAEKAGDYFRFKNYDEAAMAGYLDTLARKPPPRSRRTQRHYQGIRDIWTSWRTALQPQDKARAWGWAVRLAKTGAVRVPEKDPARKGSQKGAPFKSLGKSPAPQQKKAAPAAARTYKSGERVKCQLLEEKTRKGGWKAQIVGTQTVGHVVPGNEPPSLTAGQEVQLEIHSYRPPSPTAFRWPKAK